MIFLLNLFSLRWNKNIKFVDKILNFFMEKVIDGKQIYFVLDFAYQLWSMGKVLGRGFTSDLSLGRLLLFVIHDNWLSQFSLVNAYKSGLKHHCYYCYYIYI